MAFTTLLLSLLTVATNAQQGLQSQRLIIDEASPAVSPCHILANAFRGQVVLPQAEHSELRSTCRFLPTDPRDIQEALADILIPHNVSIAITSGGHSSVPVDKGITIDLSRLSRIRLSDDHKSVSIGPGAKWEDVYSMLEPLNLTVSGSMSSQDRVGDFVLGGGLSWLSNQYGWACDNVLEFEVVTPLGHKLWANKDLHQGLFWALKGSSGALGIVTKITAPTIPSEAIYGGALNPEEVHLPRLLQAIEDLAVSAPHDHATSGCLLLTWHASAKSFSYSSYIVDTANNESSAAFAAFRAIPHSTSSLRTMTIGESAEEVAGSINPQGIRRSQFTLTIRLSTKAMHTVHDAALVAARDLGLDKNETCRVTFQPITIPHLLASYRKDVFDLDPAHGPLLLISVELSWMEAEREAHFNDKAKALQKLLEEKMESMKVLQEFIHPLYAASDQNLFAQEKWKTSPNGKMLTAIARTYDPDELWRRMVPGIWHV